MKLIVRDVAPPPPEKEVVITMSLTEAMIVRNNLRQLSPASPVKYHQLIALEDALSSNSEIPK